MVSEADARERPGRACPRAVAAGTSPSQGTSSRGTCVTTSWGKALVTPTRAGTRDPENTIETLTSRVNAGIHRFRGARFAT